MTVDAYHQRVRDVMVQDIVCVNAGDTLNDVLDAMMENGLSTLPVVDENRRCVGMIAAVDLLAPTHTLDDGLRRLALVSTEGHEDFVDTFHHSTLSGSRVQDFMSTHVAVVSPDAPLVEAARIMLRNQVHHLVVVDTGGDLRGILSTMDILNSFAAGGSLPSSS